MKTLKSKKGFTIVELVIVIAVIAILAAVLIPTFSNVVTEAKAAAAQSQARNVWNQYCVDHAKEGYADFNGYVAIEKGTDDSNNKTYYYFKITNGQLNSSTEQSGTVTDTEKVDNYNDLYKKANSSEGTTGGGNAEGK